MKDMAEPKRRNAARGGGWDLPSCRFYLTPSHKGPGRASHEGPGRAEETQCGKERGVEETDLLAAECHSSSPVPCHTNMQMQIQIHKYKHKYKYKCNAAKDGRMRTAFLPLSATPTPPLSRVAQAQALLCPHGYPHTHSSNTHHKTTSQARQFDFETKRLTDSEG